MLQSRDLYYRIVRYFTGAQLPAMTLCLVSCTSNSGIIKMKKLNDYPSASAVEYFNNRYYVMGDDSKNLVILDSDLVQTDSISLYTSAEKRIPKPIKGDIEAITLTKNNKLLLLGSGSIFPYRGGGWVIVQSLSVQIVSGLILSMSVSNL